jgi:hypothetical protein
MNNIVLRYFLVVSFPFFAGYDAPRGENRSALFNGKDLSGWDTYLGPSYDTVKNEWGNDTIGLNNDPLKVFSVIDHEGYHCLRISGQHFGGISTTEQYANYHLRLKFKWGEEKSAPRKTNKRDSGVLYHAVGGHGADFGFWMRSQEYQVQEGDCGDYWGVAGGSFDVRARMLDSASYVYDPKGELYTFNEISSAGRRCMRSADMEKPGKWNVIEIYCLGDTAVHLLNGEVVMALVHSGQLQNGRVIPLTAGKIQLQSEGAEIFYRDIDIQPIRQIPFEIVAQFR